jgi:hypothetical protein
VGKIAHKTAADRVCGKRHDNRYLTRRTFSGADCGFAASHDDVNRKLNQFLCKGPETIHLPRGVPLLQDVVATLNISEVAHTEDELAAQILGRRIGARTAFEITEADEHTLLRNRGERPSRHAAGKTQ